MRIINNITLGVLLALTLLLAGCSNEGDLEDSRNGSAGEVTVKLNVPVVRFSGDGTRAGEQSSEGWLSNLYLVVIKEGTPEEDSNGFNIYELDTSGTNPQVGSEDPTVFYVNLAAGNTYRLYLLANFNRYLSRFVSVTNIQTEKALKDIALNFTSNMPLEPAHLPMACLPDEFTGSSISDGKLIIPAREENADGSASQVPRIEIEAKLKFLCSKVRYTILYDNTPDGFSNKFGNNSIRFVVNQNTDRPSADNLRKQTSLIFNRKAEGIYDSDNFYIMNSDGTGHASWMLSLNRYKYPSNGADYPESSADALELWPSDTNLKNWKASLQRAWQGVIYLPENNPSSEEGYTNRIEYLTTLNFPFVMEKYVGADGNYEEVDLSSLAEIPRKSITLFGKGNVNETHYGPDYSKDPMTSGQSNGLKRGYFYDVVAKVVNPNPEDLEMYIQVYVGDHPWVYHDNGGQIWGK